MIEIITIAVIAILFLLFFEALKDITNILFDRYMKWKAKQRARENREVVTIRRLRDGSWVGEYERDGTFFKASSPSREETRDMLVETVRSFGLDTSTMLFFDRRGKK